MRYPQTAIWSRVMVVMMAGASWIVCTVLVAVETSMGVFISVSRSACMRLRIEVRSASRSSSWTWPCAREGATASTASNAAVRLDVYPTTLV